MKNNVYQLKIFFLLTFLLTWAFWVPFVLHSLNLITLPILVTKLQTPFMMLGAFMPFIASLLTTRHINGKEEAFKVFKSYFQLSFKLQYVLIALILPLALTIIARELTIRLNIDQLPNSLMPQTNIPLPIVFVLYFFVMLFFGGGQEEFGWRGFAQSRLNRVMGLPKASLLLGLIWGLWHLPLWYMPGDGHGYYSFVAFVVFTIALSLIMGVLYEISGHKVLILVLFHAMINTTVPFFPVLHMAPVPQPGYNVFVGLCLLTGICVQIWYIKTTKPALKY